MCCSHFGNGVRNGAISIICKWSSLNEYYKVNPIGQWRKMLVIPIEFVEGARGVSACNFKVKIFEIQIRIKKMLFIIEN